MNDLQKKMVQQRCNSMSIERLLQLVQTKEISLDELPGLSPERKAYIEENVNKVPNAQEQKEWAEIQPLLETQDELLLDKLKNYILQWEGTRPTGNHVDEALQLYHQVEAAVSQAIAAKEETDWMAVDPFSKSSLLGHLDKYPHTTHRDEIEEGVWACSNKESVSDLKDHLRRFPNGRFFTEVQQLLDSIVEWDNVKHSGDIFTVCQYLRNHEDTPFRKQANQLILELKQKEKKKMKDKPNEYELDRLQRLLNEAIVTENELVNEGLMTQSVLDVIFTQRALPDINKAISNSTPECKKGFTDVFFFGIPSTGKTCVLMGLSRSSDLHINLASGGGNYASALQQYIDAHRTVPATPGNFVTTLEATINEGSADHNVNLVEMSGEEFAFRIANNDEGEFSFEDMGTGATELLKNDNRKVFFLIIDPTADTVSSNREVLDGYDEITGQRITHLEPFTANQSTIIHKMVDLFNHEKNEDIMRKVDAIHIIMTKSDMLGDLVKRDDKALEIFNKNFRDNILRTLITLSKRYNINNHNDNRPKLYTFSLGTFYVGGLYEYIQTDSNRLVKAIRNSTRSQRELTLWDKFKKTVN